MLQAGYQGSWLTLDEVRAHLSFDDGDHTADDKLGGYIDTAISVIEKLVGPVTPTPASELFDPGQWLLALSGYPILSVDAVVFMGTTLDPSFWNFDRSDNTVYSRWGAPFAWYGRKTVEVHYTLGRSAVPANIHMAGLELVRHMWDQAQQGQRPLLGGAGGDSYQPGMGYLIPNRVRELLDGEMPGPAVA